MADITFDIDYDLTDHPVVTLRMTTPAGPVTFMAQPVIVGNEMMLLGLHVQDSRPNAVGHANLMVLAKVLMERMDLDGLVINGALRTTGANPNRRPRSLRFARRVRPALTGRRADAADD